MYYVVVLYNANTSCQFACLCACPSQHACMCADRWPCRHAGTHDAGKHADMCACVHIEYGCIPHYVVRTVRQFFPNSVPDIAVLNAYR